MRPRLDAGDYAFLDHPGPLAFAHRGGTGYAHNTGPGAGGLENSMAAFQAAVDLGYRYLETDVQVTADGAVVAFHDPSLDRTTDGTGNVADLRYDDLRRNLIGGRETIPLLEDLLQTWPQARLNIDVKVRGAIDPVVRVVRRHGAEDRVCFASFSGRTIGRVRRLLGPRVATAYGPLGVAAVRTVPLGALRRGLLSAPVPCLQVPWRRGRLEVVTPGFVSRAHALGKHVHVWTVDDPGEMRTLLDRGVDGLISDRIDTLRDVLEQRGQWVDSSR
ncbi:MAG TPA: glycerophosphodiester phosphodiesterase [Nocardioidaceae bacterium]|nr:glycerophosphodiester phosphodiesterase [Nocardioidaceae bacterium]